MKGVKKCYGLLLALPIMLGLSLSVCSGDSSAYKYNVTVMPIVIPRPMSNGGINTSAFSLVTSNDILPSSYLAKNTVEHFTSSSFSSCDYNVTSDLPYYYSSRDRYYVFYGFDGFTSDLSLPSSWPSISPCLYVDSRASWSGIYVHDSYSDNGLDYQNKFDLSNVFGVDNFPNVLYGMTLPLGTPSQSVLSSLSSNTVFDISGEFVLDFDDPSNSGLTNSSTVGVSVDYIDSYGHESILPFSSSCSVDVGRDNPSDPMSVWYLRYNCSGSLDSMVDSSSDYLPFFRLVVSFDYLNSNTKLYQMIYDSSVIVTDHNESPAPDSWGDQSVYGTDIQNAPGSAQQSFFSDIVSDGINWTTSLTSLFGFTFLNPFAPIFNLFSDQNSCASIPTLSGMIHSEETEVCPWFDSTTRNIVTPVLSIASVMLIFGFAVRWLGASSGNMFEDSDSHTWGNTTFRQKGGK